MQPKIRHWRLNSQNWPPPGKLQKLQGNHNTRQNCFSFTRCHIVSAGSSENGITGALHRHVLLWRWMPISCWNNYMRFSQMGYWHLESFISCKCKEHRSKQSAKRHPLSQANSSIIIKNCIFKKEEIAKGKYQRTRVCFTTKTTDLKSFVLHIFQSKLEETYYLWSRNKSPENNGSFTSCTNAVSNRFSSSAVQSNKQNHVSLWVMLNNLATKIYDLVNKFFLLVTSWLPNEKVYFKPCEVILHKRFLSVVVNHSKSDFSTINWVAESK